MKSTATLKDQIVNLVVLLRSYRFRFSNEEDLQDAVEQLFIEAHVPYEREKELGESGRIDFLVGGNIGLEIKTKGSPSQVAKQVIRYCERDEISSVVLLTARITLGRLLPLKVHGKTVTIVGTWESMI